MSRTKHLGLIPNAKYMNPASGSVDTGSWWESTYLEWGTADIDDNWKLVRVKKSRTSSEKDKHGEWTPYNERTALIGK